MINQEKSNKSLYIKTYGCQMNVYDSNKMADLLKPHGFQIVDDITQSDMVILNTCHIREKASEKVYSELGKIAILKKAKADIGSSMVVVVAGCVAQAEGEEMVKRAPVIDIVVGPQSYHNLPILLEEVKRKNSWVVKLDFEQNTKFDNLAIDTGMQGHSAFLSIQEGCDKFCHFCCVPYTRGAEYSRPAAEVYREGLILVSNGAKEITLLGQNVSAYHGVAPNTDDQINNSTSWSLGRLIKELALIPNLERIRYTTSHPMDMLENAELFEAHATQPKLMPFLHLPIQSGSDRILKAMNRNHDVATYLDIIEKFKKHRKDIAFSSDFIVGFPGETEEDFRQTLELAEKVKYAQAYSFKYSPRPGTPASFNTEQIAEEVKDRRLQELQAVLRKHQLEFNQSKIGEVIEILVEKRGKKSGQMIGKSPHMQSVIVSGGDELVGKLISVKINHGSLNSLNAQSE